MFLSCTMEMVPIRSQSKCHVNYFTFHEEDKNKLDGIGKTISCHPPRTVSMCSCSSMVWSTCNLSLHPLLHNDSAPLPPLPNPCYNLGGCCGCFVFNILPNLSIFSSRLLLLTTFNYPILHRMTWYYIQLNSSIFFHYNFRLAASYSCSQQEFQLGDCYTNSFLSP